MEKKVMENVHCEESEDHQIQRSGVQLLLNMISTCATLVVGLFHLGILYSVFVTIICLVICRFELINEPMTIYFDLSILFLLRWIFHVYGWIIACSVAILLIMMVVYTYLIRKEILMGFLQQRFPAFIFVLSFIKFLRIENLNELYNNQPLTIRVCSFITAICNAYAASYGFIHLFNIRLSGFTAVLPINLAIFMVLQFLSSLVKICRKLAQQYVPPFMSELQSGFTKLKQSAHFEHQPIQISAQATTNWLLITILSIANMFIMGLLSSIITTLSQLCFIFIPVVVLILQFLVDNKPLGILFDLHLLPPLHWFIHSHGWTKAFLVSITLMIFIHCFLLLKLSSIQNSIWLREIRTAIGPSHPILPLIFILGFSRTFSGVVVYAVWFYLYKYWLYWFSKVDAWSVSVFESSFILLWCCYKRFFTSRDQSISWVPIH